MTKLHQLPQPDARYNEASLWIAKLDRQLSPEEEAAFDEWMAADPENEALLLKMAKLWDKMDALSRLSDLFPEPLRHRPVLPRFAFAVAASAVLAVGAGAWFMLGVANIRDLSNSPATTAANARGVYETAVGEQSKVTLADGSEIILNTNTRLWVRYTDAHRLLTLERGELHVRVAEDKRRPLSVIAGDTIVQAVGTEFNVEITADQRIELVVTEGKVRVGVQSQGPIIAANERDEPVPPTLPATAVTVAAGEELILGAPEEEIVDVSDADIEVKLSWRTGNLIFRGELLGEAIEEIGRYTSVEFVFLDEDLKKMRVAGMFKAGDVDGLLAALRANFDIAYERIDEKTVLLSVQ